MMDRPQVAVEAEVETLADGHLGFPAPDEGQRPRGQQAVESMLVYHALGTGQPPSGRSISRLMM